MQHSRTGSTIADAIWMLCTDRVETEKQEVKKPFPQEQELKEKSKRLSELDALLNMDERQSETMDEEPEKGDEQRKVQCAHLER